MGALFMLLAWVVLCWAACSAVVLALGALLAWRARTPAAPVLECVQVRDRHGLPTSLVAGASREDVLLAVLMALEVEGACLLDAERARRKEWR